MKKNLFWMLAMLVCGAGVFTACSTSVCQEPVPWQLVP